MELEMNISFTAQPVYENLYVKKLTPDGDYKPAPATFVEIDPKDSEDKETFDNLDPKWNSTTFFTSIKTHFFNNAEKNNFYALAVDGDEPLEKRILCLAMVKDEKDHLHLRYLQGHPDIIYDNRKYKKSKTEVLGAGNLTTYGVVKQAVDMEKPSGIKVPAANDEYFKKIGMKIDKTPTSPTQSFWELMTGATLFKMTGLATPTRSFTPKEAAKFLEETEEKYKIDKTV